MNYIELAVEINPKQPGLSAVTVAMQVKSGTDYLISELAETGFESFAENENGFCAYIPEKDFSDAALAPLNNFPEEMGIVRFNKKIIPAQNWNAVWESNFEPLLIGGKCFIRAPFHAPHPSAEIDLVIQPQQSFGTGHHPTTKLIAEKLLTLPLRARYVMDMGCGTGILAILAAKLGALPVRAIDIDPGAVENTRENVLRNRVDVMAETGDDRKFGKEKFDVIIANINRNILAAALPAYANALLPNGVLLLSGFFTGDVQLLTEIAMKNNLSVVNSVSENEWAMLHLKK